MKLPSSHLGLLFAIVFMAQTSPGVAQTEPPAVTNHLSESAAKLARDIARRRARGEGFTILTDMNKLMELWTPVGLTKERVVELLGKPSARSTDKVIIYLFDNGEGGWQWEFYLEKGVVSKVYKQSLE